jgi:hypothetical protein
MNIMGPVLHKWMLIGGDENKLLLHFSKNRKLFKGNLNIKSTQLLVIIIIIIKEKANNHHNNNNNNKLLLLVVIMIKEQIQHFFIWLIN